MKYFYFLGSIAYAAHAIFVYTGHIQPSVFNEVMMASLLSVTFLIEHKRIVAMELFKSKLIEAIKKENKE